MVSYDRWAFLPCLTVPNKPNTCWRSNQWPKQRVTPNSYGFRRERSCADAIEQCFHALYRKEAAEWVLAPSGHPDIQACFDKIDHDWLLTHVPTDKKTLQ